MARRDQRGSERGERSRKRGQLRAELRGLFPARERGELLPALHHLQHSFGYLPDWAMEVVSWHLGVPASEVYGAATSYPELRTERPGRHVVTVCTGLSCRVSGADAVLEALAGRLGVEPGGTADRGDGATVTLERTACGFLCGVAPAVRMDGRWIARASPERAVREVDALRPAAGP